MAKGIFSQGVCVLLNKTVTLDQIEPLLSEFTIKGRKEAGESWGFGGPSLVIPYREDVNGLGLVDVVDMLWPTEAGDPLDGSELFAAWAMGLLGPFAFPGCLERASQQCLAMDNAAAAVAKHKAFIRVRCGYAFGSGGDAPSLPEGYEPVEELEFTMKIATALLNLPGAICLFNPGGEVLNNAEGISESLGFSEENDLPPLDLWSNIRIYQIDDDLILMDTIGNGQLDIPDLEACFHEETYDADEVEGFLRNITFYLMTKGDVFEEEDVLEGPGEVEWMVKHFKEGLSAPPRPVLRWFPLDGRELPDELVEEMEGDDESDDE